VWSANIVDSARSRRRLEPILVMKPAQNRRRDNALAIGQLMAVRRHRAIRRRVRKSRSQAAMWAAAIVMRDPSRQDVAQVRFGQRNEEVQTLAPNGANQAFAECVGMSGRVHRLRAVRPKPFESRIPFIRYIGASSS